MSASWSRSSECIPSPSVISAEAVLTLTDLYVLDFEAAAASIVRSARLITEATFSRMRAGPANRLTPVCDDRIRHLVRR
jgi:hypothetical protein